MKYPYADRMISVRSILATIEGRLFEAALSGKLSTEMKKDLAEMLRAAANSMEKL